MTPKPLPAGQLSGLASAIRDMALKDVPGASTENRMLTTAQAMYLGQVMESIASSDAFTLFGTNHGSGDSGYGFDASGNYKKIFMWGRDGFGADEDWIL